MQLFGSLGIDVKLLVAQMINFGLLLWLFKRFVYKPIIDRIEKDEQALAQAQQKAQQLQREQETFAQTKEKTVMEAKKKSQQIIQEAEDVAEQIKSRARQEAAQEKQAVIEQIHARLKEVNNE
ncbi:ATP synthase F0 subunit B [Candidatus Woesebacteria bacterium]|nr:ATP synthase F0 subunit B [Candidatus Woesebacteria bacterium]